MRPDMDKVLVLRGRLGGDRDYHKRNRSKVKQLLHEEKYDDVVSHEAMKPKVSWDDLKELNENLNPLEHFLEKSVGRKWDDVYSEIRKRVNANSAVQYHILQHLEHMVEKHALEATDGTLFTIGGWWSRNNELHDGTLYVCPDTGILKRYKRKEKVEKKEEIVRYNFVDDETKTLEKIDGIWYYCEYGYSDHGWYDNDGTYHPYRSYGIVKKEQLSKKELQEYGLNNSIIIDKKAA